VGRQKVLLVDDESEIRNLLRIFLDVEDFEVAEAETGKAALRQTVAENPDLVVLDLGLPDMDGQHVLRSIREFSNVPVIVLTATGDDARAVAALGAGADDFVVKPFNVESFLARIRANLRTCKTASSEGFLENGPIRMNLTRHEVYIDGQRLFFTPKEFHLLEFLMRNRGRVLTHRQILKEVWGPAHIEDTQYLRVYIGQVREKLRPFRGLGGAIVSEARVGYRMEALGAEAQPTSLTVED
jgi:two-component system KDP operon response regulator KdpE